MIGKLISHEIRILMKPCALALGLATLVALLSLTLTALNLPLLGALGVGIGILAAIGAVVAVLSLLAASYWRTMYGREGYFTMAIPVRGRTLFAVKTGVGVLAAWVALIVCGLLLFATAAAFAIAQGDDPLAFVRQGIDTIGTGMLWLLIGALLLQLAYTVIAGAALMSIGAQARYNYMGFGAPVVGALLLYLVMQVVGLAAMLFIPLGIRLGGDAPGEFVTEGMLPTFIEQISNGSDQTAGVPVLGLGIFFVSVAASVLLAWWGARSVDRRTSLR